MKREVKREKKGEAKMSLSITTILENKTTR